jgi:hypothetical protein
VANVLEEAGLFSKRFRRGHRGGGYLSDKSVARMLDPEFGSRPLAEQAKALAHELRDATDPVSFLGQKRYKLRQEGRDVPSIVKEDVAWTPEISDRLLDPKFSRQPLQTQIVALEREFGLEVTPQALADRRRVLREAGNTIADTQRSTPDKFQWTDEALARLTSAEFRNLSAAEKAAALDPTGQLSANSVRQKMSRQRKAKGKDAVPLGRRRWPEKVRAWVATKPTR